MPENDLGAAIDDSTVASRPVRASFNLELERELSSERHAAPGADFSNSFIASTRTVESGPSLEAA